MINLLEAAKQALEALEVSFDILDPSLYPKAENMVAYSITNLKAAIEAAEKPLIDPNCKCDEHRACSYCWEGKKQV